MKVKFNVKRYFQVLGISLAVIIAAAAVCMGIDFSSSNNEEAVDNTSTVEAADGKINVLLMGVDVDGLRTDAIMLASFDTETKEVNMLSIPRDTKMETVIKKLTPHTHLWTKAEKSAVRQQLVRR